LLAGELQEKTRVRLLVSGALGGMLIPALLYLSINVGVAGGEPQGWGIPMATDTAMVIGVLAALGAHAPKSVIAFLVGLAIIDDIGAILIIALFYTNQLDVAPLSVAALLLGAMMCINWAGLHHPLFYIIISVALWVTIVQSGVHASTAGVIAAATVPARPRMKPKILKHHVGSVSRSVLLWAFGLANGWVVRNDLSNFPVNGYWVSACLPASVLPCPLLLPTWHWARVWPPLQPLNSPLSWPLL
jgi:NhaA family Na+:H+ antiporter